MQHEKKTKWMSDVVCPNYRFRMILNENVNASTQHVVTSDSIKRFTAGMRCTYKINGLCIRLLIITAPRLTPQPLLRQRLDADLMNHVVWQVLAYQQLRWISANQSSNQ